MSLISWTPGFIRWGDDDLILVSLGASGPPAFLTNPSRLLKLADAG